MRNKLLILAIFLATLGFGYARAADETAGEETKPLSPKEVSQEMSEVWCQKMDQCAKDKSMSIKECQGVLFKSFKQGFDHLPKGQPLNLKRDTLEECKTNVTKGTCDSLKMAKTLPGCEFISALGQ